MSSDSEQELYARTSKKQKEFLAQKQAATRAVIDFIPDIEPKLKRSEPEDHNSSDSNSWSDSPVKVKRRRPEVATKKSNLKKIVDLKRGRRKKQNVSFASTSSESDDNSQASFEAATKANSSSSSDKDSASPSPTCEDLPAMGTSGRSPIWDQSRDLSPTRDGIADQKYLLAAERLASLASKRASAYPKFDISCEQIDDNSDSEETITVKVRWRLDVLKLEIAKTQCFRTFHEYFSELGGVQPSRILITLRDKPIRPEETPNSIKLRPVIDILVAGVIDEVKEPEATASLAGPITNPNEIELKIQSVNRRETVTVKVLKNEPISVMMHKYANLTGKELSKLKFKFDGEILNQDLSADALEFDGGECIDVFEVL